MIIFSNCSSLFRPPLPNIQLISNSEKLAKLIIAFIFKHNLINTIGYRARAKIELGFTQRAWMHLRCISETPHTAFQRCLKEGLFSNLWDFLKFSIRWRLIRDVSSETSLRSLRFSQRRLWVASERLSFLTFNTFMTQAVIV